ncbi:MAG TPA: GTPase ObgE [Candidatus Paceibacterota bacterium]|nr:GTPase ObgE [Candidatus Paceibacterota bacterium]
MAFVDEVTIKASAGKGGDGVVRWLHLKGKERAGPAGGNGGRGGDVILEGVRDLGALAAFRFLKSIRGQNGQSGSNNNKYGADGAPAVLRVPVGTIATDLVTGQVYEILEEGEQKVIYKGGAGGLGNAHFKGAANQNPIEATPGKQGQSGKLSITLKIIADVGFVGYPNAGKSSLLNALTRARSKVGAYPFTTLDPHLGDFYGFLLADIPGLIEGASAGRGLGSKFLRHVERTKYIAHLVSAEQDDVVEAYKSIRAELEAFGQELSGKPEIVVLSKADSVSEEELEAKRKALVEVSGKEVYVVSILDDELLKSFSDRLSQMLSGEGTV